MPGKSPRTHAEPIQKALPAKQPHRALYPGDSVYFQDTHGQAQHGTVAGVGKHGATIDVQGDDGKAVEHKVHHHRIIGHRKRAERKLVIIDRGEDGGIAVDESGKRVFLHGDLGELQEQKPEQELTKALTGDYQPADDARIIATVNAALAPVLSAMATMQQQHQQALDRFAGLVTSAIGKPLPAINLQLPEQPVPTIQVDVNVPEQAAPIVHVEPPNIIVQVPERQEMAIVSMPERRTETQVERNKEGDLKSSIQIEKDVQ